MDTKKPELGRGTFYASQVHDMVILRADGMTPTPGYKVWLERMPPDVFPPIYGLLWQAPDKPVNGVLEPFDVYTTFTSKERIKKLQVADADGLHTIDVEWVPDKAADAEAKTTKTDEPALCVKRVEIIATKSLPPTLYVYASGVARTGPSKGYLAPLPSIPTVAAFELRATRGPLQVLTKISAIHELPPNVQAVEVRSETNTVRVPIEHPSKA